MASERNAIDCLRREGFTEDFSVKSDGLHAGGGKVFRADEVVIRKLARFEGVSDPDDMAVVYGIESTDGTRGTLVDAFGVYSSPVVGDFVDAVRMTRPETVPPVDVAPPPGLE
jgi:hypothetical protein